jgi:hypothetical protein
MGVELDYGGAGSGRVRDTRFAGFHHDPEFGGTRTAERGVLVVGIPYFGL